MIDTPPVLAVSDFLIIAAHVDGISIVTNGGKPRMDVVEQAAKTLHMGSIRTVGVVVNQQSARSKDGYCSTEYNAVEEKIGILSREANT